MSTGWGSRMELVARRLHRDRFTPLTALLDANTASERGSTRRALRSLEAEGRAELRIIDGQLHARFRPIVAWVE